MTCLRHSRPTPFPRCKFMAAIMRYLIRQGDPLNSVEGNQVEPSTLLFLTTIQGWAQRAGKIAKLEPIGEHKLSSVAAH